MRERRADRRYVVERLGAAIDGTRTKIVDISQKAARLALPPGLAGRTPKGQVQLVFVSDPGANPAIDVTVRGWLIRCDAQCVVYEYDPPMRDWEACLQAYDAFAAADPEPA
jgi:hypothetical protein